MAEGAALGLAVAAATDIGRRAENQDAHGHLPCGAGTFLVLCDGMGGHAGGGEAARGFSGLVLAAAGAAPPAGPDAAETAIRDLMADAAARMRAETLAGDPSLDPHTTAVLAWAEPGRTVVAHVGDSRLYRLGTEGARWRTRDHSLVERMVAAGEMDPREAAHHPYRNAVLRSVGGAGPPEPDVALLPPLEPGEALLLCSDGFWEHVGEDEMAALVGASDPQADLGAMVALAVRRGGRHADNATALLALRRTP